MRPSALTLPVADPQQPPFAACAACFTTATESALPSAATLSRMQSDHCYPSYGNRMSPKEWVEMEKPDLLETATTRKNTILGAPSAAALDPVIDRAIRAKFNIHLKG